MKIAIVSLVIAILVAIFSFFQFERYQHFSLNVKQAIRLLNEKLDKRVSDLNQRVNKLETDESPRPNNIGQASTLPANAANFDPEKIKETWSFHSAYHLTRLAFFQLQQANDVPYALTLLQEANQILEPIQNAQAMNYREALQTQIKKLSGLELPNLTEIWSQLGVLITEVPRLPLQGDRNIEQKDKSQNKNAKVKLKTKIQDSKSSETNANEQQNLEADTKEQSGWKKALHHTWADVKDLVKIQRHTKPIEPLLSSAERQYAYDNLTLLLEQTRLSLLNKNQTIYQKSLQQAKELVVTYFATEDAKVDNFIARLDELSKVNLTPELPDLKPLLKLLSEGGK